MASAADFGQSCRQRAGPPRQFSSVVRHRCRRNRSCERLGDLCALYSLPNQNPVFAGMEDVTRSNGHERFSGVDSTAFNAPVFVPRYQRYVVELDVKRVDESF
jgi:hypothetical protein